MEKLAVEGLANLLAAIEQRKGKIIILVCGSLDPTTGDSWCPDCVTAEPVVAKVVDEELGDGAFIHCTVGTREQWKDPENEFRKHPDFRLSGVPTLLRWGTPQRLGPDDCAKEALVRLLVTDEED